MMASPSSGAPLPSSGRGSQASIDAWNAQQGAQSPATPASTILGQALSTLSPAPDFPPMFGAYPTKPQNKGGSAQPLALTAAMSPGSGQLGTKSLLGAA